ncbi:hypothetical protein [Actinoplanes palleronii]|uniref:Uncharacterized protein n=1 Tax=Actinoplanes palleronii TaxID=113570 RepID=A0ABQ4BKJ1_9ACTN|nr:hypothetical protein [Actinoplanes palleronii]GIE70765.1 hypothetical protein Apa02nite_068730 [Actinoplanes palleronii]
MTDTQARVAKMFELNTVEHELTVLHDDGLYRHILMAKPGTGLYRYELITWPGHLAISGDLDSYVFARIQDMFAFFRGHEVNPTYWAEKVKDDHKRTSSYSEDMFKQLVTEHLDDLADADLTDEQRETRDEIKERVNDGEGDCEDGAREILRDGEQAGLWSGTWEWDLRDWDWHFLYCLNAIVAGIKAYDKAKTRTAEAVDA